MKFIMRNMSHYFDVEGFIENYHDLNHTFQSIYKNYQLSYSYKTNYTPYICEIVKQLGGYAEVVSDMEYLLAKKIGYENCHIVDNGPAKGELLEEHILNGGIVNVDNYDEMIRICKLAQKYPQIKIKLSALLGYIAISAEQEGLGHGAHGRKPCWRQ